MTNGGYLSKAAILSVEDLEFRDVHVPEWGGTVRVREMTAGDRERFGDLFESRQAAKDSGEQAVSIQAWLVAMCVVDEKGQRIFDAAAVSALELKSSRALMRVFDVAMELSALKKENVEGLAKNSEPSPRAVSSSD